MLFLKKIIAISKKLESDLVEYRFE